MFGITTTYNPTEAISATQSVRNDADNLVLEVTSMMTAHRKAMMANYDDRSAHIIAREEYRQQSIESLDKLIAQATELKESIEFFWAS